eukprot:1160391-Pelagomonas_calceolata.AAC.10
MLPAMHGLNMRTCRCKLASGTGMGCTCGSRPQAESLAWVAHVAHARRLSRSFGNYLIIGTGMGYTCGSRSAG